MPLDVRIFFHGVDHSPAVVAAVQRRAEELEQFSDRLIACRVILEAVDHRHHQRALYRVRIELALAGGLVVADSGPGQHHAHEGIYVAIRDAFEAVRRQLQDNVYRLDGQTPAAARIVDATSHIDAASAKLADTDDSGFA